LLFRPAKMCETRGIGFHSFFFLFFACVSNINQQQNKNKRPNFYYCCFFVVRERDVSVRMCVLKCVDVLCVFFLELLFDRMRLFTSKRTEAECVCVCVSQALQSGPTSQYQPFHCCVNKQNKIKKTKRSAHSDSKVNTRNRTRITQQTNKGKAHKYAKKKRQEKLGSKKKKERS
jgi:hypothetical protein